MASDTQTLSVAQRVTKDILAVGRIDTFRLRDGAEHGRAGSHSKQTPRPKYDGGNTNK